MRIHEPAPGSINFLFIQSQNVLLFYLGKRVPHSIRPTKHTYHSYKCIFYRTYAIITKKHPF